MDEFLKGLGQRRLVQWTLAYVAASFALIQVLDIVAQRFAWPESAIRYIIMVLAVGIFPVLVLAWYHGERGAQRVSGRELLILALLLTIGGAVVLRLAPTATQSVAGSGAASAALPATPDGKSIAVLPFENLSDDKANAYFAEGIQEEIITQLAKIGALKVISHTSTQLYASRPAQLGDIAQQLSVANVLEGSVQKAANSVHINVQLIQARTAQNLWADSYNRTLDDIFGVEGEVARTVAQTLKARLSGTEVQLLSTPPTANAAAYAAYLRGIAFKFRVDEAATNTENSIVAFGEAVHLDPEFGLAWANLSQQRSFAYWYIDPSATHKDAARQALQQALRLAPDAPETLMAQGLDRYWLERDYEGAKVIFERVRTQFPNFADAPWTLAAIARRQGRWQDARVLGDETVALDPQNIPRLFDTASTLLAMRDLPALHALLERGLATAPADSALLATRICALQMQGDVDAAQAIIEHVPVAHRDTFLIEAIARNALLTHRYAGAIAVLQAQVDAKEGLGTDMGEYAGLLGDLQRLAGAAGQAQASYRRARDALQEQLRGEPDCQFCFDRLAMAEAGLGNKAQAFAAVDRAIGLLPAAKDAFFGPTYEEDRARLQARFGDADGAIAGIHHLLGMAYGYPPLTPAMLRLDPDWDSLRADARFQALLAP